MKKLNKKGFTIVELVIVIAVIAILSAVLIPTFSGVVGEAKETALLSDAKAKYQEYVAQAALAGTDAATLAVYIDNAGTADNDTDDKYVVIENGTVATKSLTKAEFEAKYKESTTVGETSYKVATSDATANGKTFAGLRLITAKVVTE